MQFKQVITKWCKDSETDISALNGIASVEKRKGKTVDFRVNLIMKLEHKSKDNKTVHDTEQKKQRATIQLSNKMNPHHSLTKKNGG